MIKFQNFIQERLKNNEFCYEEFFTYFSQTSDLPVYTYKIQKGQPFYRARINETFSNYENFKDLSYPPENVLLKYGRANKPLQSVLYLSDKWKTNLAELKLFLINKISSGDIIWITQAEWIATEIITVTMIPDFENKKMKDFIDKFVRNMTENKINFLKIINKYFNDNIANDNGITYQLTSAFCNAMISESIRKNNKTDGILYSSVQDITGFNFALNRSVIDDKKLILNSVVKHYLQKTEKRKINNCIPPIIPDSLDFQNEKIIWK